MPRGLPVPLLSGPGGGAVAVLLRDRRFAERGRASGLRLEGAAKKEAAVEDKTATEVDRDEAGCYRRALEQIHALALRGLEQANASLALADEREDWESWSLWRGHRRALLEVLAVTDQLALPEAEVSYPTRSASTDAPAASRPAAERFRACPARN
jgi:hypothetical protein